MLASFLTKNYTKSFATNSIAFNNFNNFSSVRNFATNIKPVRVAVTGASGAIGYAILFRIASGAMLGPNTPIHLQLLELPQALKSLKGVVMELDDCAFPLLSGITTTSDPNVAFEGTSYALLVGAKPRSPGMERGDLLKENANIFSVQGKALNDHADRNAKVLVVGNPANTNALIAANNAPKLNPKNFTAMTRLDHNRGIGQLANQTNTHVSRIEKFAIWGNHSATQFPDVSNVLLDGKPAKGKLDEKWVKETFIPAVQKRGAAILEARGVSSAASAASAAIDHMRDWTFGTNGQWTSMAVLSDGSYGATKGLYFSYPVVIDNKGQYSIVQGLNLDEFSKQKFDATHKELLGERDGVKDKLPQ